MRTTIALYSATGNSLYAAKSIPDAEILFIDRILDGECPVPEDTERLGIVFPVYMGGLPCPVRRFISECLAERDNSSLGYVFIIATHGGMPLYALADADRSLQDAGIALSYAASVRMPDAYLPLQKKAVPIEKAEIMRKEADGKLMAIASDIAAERIRLPHKGPGWRLIRHFSAKAGRPAPQRGLTVSQRCTGCGTCVSVCPMGNISMRNGQAAFSGECISCFACYHRCPENAIDYKGAAGQYRGFVSTDELRRR